MLTFALPALAQDVVFEDFDTNPPPLSVYLGGAWLEAPAVPHAGTALRASPQLGPGEGYAGIELMGPYLATHARARFDEMADDLYPNGVQVFLYGDAGGFGALMGNVLTTSNVWSTYEDDVSAVCGDQFFLDLVAFTGNEYQTGTYPVEYWVDELAFTGDPCPMFVDADADGLCEQGVDLDGDGTCVQSGEAFPPGTVVDCDDSVPGGCLTLAVPTLVPGASASFVVVGGAPGESATVLIARSAGSRCPSSLGGACLGIDAPRKLGSGTVAADGTATVVVTVPAGLPSGTTRWFQGMVVRTGQVGDTSPVVVSTIP